MKNNGFSDYTIKNTSKLLKYLDKHTDLNNPDSVKTAIATHTSNNYKRNLCFAYKRYAQHLNIKWQMPKYRQDHKTRRIPTSEKLEMIIAKAGKTLATKLRISKESSARKLKISANLNTLIQTHIIRHKLNSNDKLFRGNAARYGNAYRATRNALAKKLQDPIIHQIKLYDFRHYFATMLYAKTRDILYVKQQMGHKSIDTTLIYTQLIHYNEEEQYTCKTATTIKEATNLLENGFTYIQEIDGIRIYRKRK